MLALMNNLCQILKRDPGSYIKGIWKPGRVTEIRGIKCSIQPISGRDVQILPEGDRDKVEFKIYFSEPEPLSLEYTIRLDNIEYKIIKDTNWTDAPFILHNRVFVARMD